MFAILRIQKLKHAVSVQRSMAHALRTQDTPNADPSRLADNTKSVDSVKEALEKFNNRLATQPKIRSNAVLAVEYLITASPDAMNGKTREQQDTYFADAMTWLEAKHGKENVVAWGVHRDETTPHMYAIVVPIDLRGKLNCRGFIGNASSLREMQTDFAATVGSKNGLVRGVEGSKAKHQSIQKYYAMLNSATPEIQGIEVPPLGAPEMLNPRGYGSRVADAVLDQLRPAWDSLQSKASAFEIEKTRATAALVVAEREMERADGLEQELSVKIAIVNEMNQLFTQDEISVAWDRREERKVEAAAKAAAAVEAANKAAAEAAIATEQRRRIDWLLNPDRTIGGALYVLSQLAKKHVAEFGKERVDWAKIDSETVKKSIRDHGQTPQSVIETLCSYSPKRADPQKHQEVHDVVNRVAPALQAEYTQARDAREGKLESKPNR